MDEEKKRKLRELQRKYARGEFEVGDILALAELMNGESINSYTSEE